MPVVEPAVNRPYVPLDGTKITARVDIEPGEQSEPVERHVALCIDTSGSMTGEKIERARDGIRWVFGLLDPDDYVTVVGFDSEASLVLRPTRWGEIDREIAEGRIADLAAGGGTNMFDGLRRAREALNSLDMRPDAGRQRSVRRILLLSDGKDSSHDVSEFRDLAVDIDQSGIRVEAAGVGEDYNAETIQTLGTTARGTWTHLEGPGDIESFFGEAVEQAGTVVATDARLELDTAAGVDVSGVYRAQPQAQDVDLDREDDRLVVKLPDLTERDRQRVVMEVHVPPREATGRADLVDLSLTARGGRAGGTVAVEYTDDDSKLAVHNDDVQLDHQQTVVQAALGKGNVETAETQIEKMTLIHGDDQVIEEVDRHTQLVKEGGKAERNRATKPVGTEGRIQE